MFAVKHPTILKRGVRENITRGLRARFGAPVLLAASLVGLIAPADAWTLAAEARLHGTNEHHVGVVRLIQLGSGEIIVQARVHGLPAGFHGFHVHTVGECVRGTPPTQDVPGVPGTPGTPDFVSAGGHFDTGRTPPAQPHTHQNHSGDFPVLLVTADETANAIFSTDRFDLADLFDSDGSAIIVHAAPDNYANIPSSRYASKPTETPATVPDEMTQRTGDSGDRIACGVIKKLIDR